MHTSKFDIKGYDGPVTVIHNSDWSGPVSITWSEGGEERTSEVPGELLTLLSMDVAISTVREKVVGFLEDMDVPDG